jgi:hypothetical protein
MRYPAVDDAYWGSLLTEVGAEPGCGKLPFTSVGVPVFESIQRKREI